MKAVPRDYYAVLHDITLDEVVAAELGALVPAGRAVRRDDLTANLVPALGLVALVEHLPADFVRTGDVTFGDREVQLLVGQKQTLGLENLSQGCRPPTVLRDGAVDCERVLDVDRVLLLD